LDEFGIESEVIGKIEYQWQHLIIVRCKTLLTQSVPDFSYRLYRLQPRASRSKGASKKLLYA